MEIKIKMRILSKSKLLALRQCPKRLWLELYQPLNKHDSSSTEASFNIGYKVGDIARQLYDPKNKGQVVDVQKEGFNAAFARTKKLLISSQPIFEAGFSAGGALAFADVMLPVIKAGKRGWRMIEVKSSASVKDYHRDDAAIQAFVARSAGVQLSSISLAYINSTWIYPGSNDYQSLLVEEDLTEEAFSREDEVKNWILEAQTITSKIKQPKMNTGKHCYSPYECGFLSFCQTQEPQALFPISWLPRIQTKALKALIHENALIDFRDIPDSLLNANQLRVKQHTLLNKVYFDAKNAALDLEKHKLPAYFLDFETIHFAIPIWKGTRPYQQIPYQFSLHRLASNKKLDHLGFIDLTGKDPSKAFAISLIAACGKQGPVYVYNEAFEKARIKELADRFPKIRTELLAINDRVVDLYRVALNRYYHPSQEGSWSIKKVLPAIAPHLSYDALSEVQNGGMATNAFMEAISTITVTERKAEIERSLFEYCKLDTYAMVKIWQFFTNNTDLAI